MVIILYAALVLQGTDTSRTINASYPRERVEKQIRRIESGIVICTLITFLKLCYALQLEPRDILDMKLNEQILND